MTLDEALRVCALRDPTHADVAALCARSGGSTDNALNAVALELARRYIARTVSFEIADALANVLFSYAAQLGSLPEPMHSIFLAFDAGEFSSDSEDPRLKHTDPQLQRILEKANAA